MCEGEAGMVYASEDRARRGEHYREKQWTLNDNVGDVGGEVIEGQLGGV